MKNLFLLSLLLFPNLDSVFLTTRESSSTFCPMELFIVPRRAHRTSSPIQRGLHIRAITFSHARMLGNFTM